jgi:hypothetical protein
MNCSVFGSALQYDFAYGCILWDCSCLFRCSVGALVLSHRSCCYNIAKRKSAVYRTHRPAFNITAIAHWVELEAGRIVVSPFIADDFWFIGVHHVPH